MIQNQDDVLHGEISDNVFISKFDHLDSQGNKEMTLRDTYLDQTSKFHQTQTREKALGNSGANS